MSSADKPIEDVDADTASEDKVPPLPQRPPVPAKPVVNLPLTFTLTDNLSTISTIRQQELYTLPMMNESSDAFANNTVKSEVVTLKLAKLKEVTTFDENGEFWIHVIEDDANQLIREKKISELEAHLIEGIPQDLRSLVYLKVLQVRFKLDQHGYENLLKNASGSSKNHALFIDSLAIDGGLKEILKIFNYYTNEVTRNSTRLEAINNNNGTLTSGDDLPPTSFVIHISKLIYSIASLTKEEILTILLRFNKIFASLIKEEFFYKTNRAFEDLLPEEFLHITKQGIILTNVYKKNLFTFFDESIEDITILLKLLDFFVFQGFDFVLRVLVAQFKKNSEKILSLEGDELNSYLISKEFFSDFTTSDFNLVLSVEAEVIKYENEYHLMHANSLNGNNHELANLKEVNDDLLIKINELKQQLENLRTTHTEILQQSEDYKKQLTIADNEQQRLIGIRDELQEKHGNLTMKENLKNTINANKDFSTRNAELENQINELKKNIEVKRGKLARYAAA